MNAMSASLQFESASGNSQEKDVIAKDVTNKTF